jgi:hypothetical protein
MAFQIARGLPLGRYDFELRAAVVALAALALAVGLNPWFYVLSAASAVFLVLHAQHGRRAAESVLDLEQSRITSGRPSRIADLGSWSGRIAHRSKGVAAAGPWRVVTDPVSEQRRLPPCGEAWTIIDACDQVVFTGTKKDCEDWLDYQDNIA